MRAVRNIGLIVLLMLGLCIVPQASAQQTGNCELGTASADLNVNNVRARLFNTGNLFWKGGDPIYTVPKTSDANAIFAHGIWLGGQVDGQLRMAAAQYENYEFWPGPLDAAGNPPVDCSQYDRIYSVKQSDITEYEQTGTASTDLQNWPVDLGAPVVDGDGNPNNYSLAGGDRPEILGSQTAWWVMNDRGGAHGTTNTPPIGLEVQVTAFAFQRSDALNDATFYRYKLVYEGNEPLTDAYFGIWADPDLGNATDDFVGSDTTRGIGFVYNGEPVDADYGNQPPALGFDYFQGPLVDSDGRDNDNDGEIDEEDERLQMSKFVYYNNNETDQGNPVTAQDYYGYLQGIWRNGEPITRGGTGIGGSVETDFMFPGDPVTKSFWSEEDASEEAGIQKNTPADRRFLMSSGPFTINPGESQEIVYGIVWAQGADRLASVTAMRNADELAQNAFDENFQLPSPPAAPVVNVGTFDKTVALSWTNPSSSNNYLDSYEVTNPFLEGQDVDDITYNFEGYKIYSYESPADQEGDLVATYDVENGITVVTDAAFDPATGAPITEVTAQGSDSGVQHSIAFRNLTNYKDYYYGVQAYAFNPNSTPKVFNGPITRVEARPSRVAPRDTGTVAQTDSINVDIDAEPVGLIDGLGAEVIDPTALTGDTYEFTFFEYSPEGRDTTLTTYNIINTVTNDTLLNGRQYVDQYGRTPPREEDVVAAEGLSFSVPNQPSPGAGPELLEISYGGNPVSPPPHIFFALNSTGSYFGSSISGVPDPLVDNELATRRDFELRFTEEGGLAVFAFEDGKIATVPFELWDIGYKANDPSDDRRMIPFLRTAPGVDETADHWRYGVGSLFGYLTSDAVYWMEPDEEGSYQQFEEALQQQGGPGTTIPTPLASEEDFSFYDQYIDFHTDFQQASSSGEFDYPAGNFVFGDFAETGTPPPTGTIVRVVPSKPYLPGDRFVLNTEEYGVETGQKEVAEAALEDIGIVPNPYKGASAYEVSNLENVARFTNLPQRATIRIFTLDGTLIRTLEKEGPGNSLDWNLETEEGLPIASGMYLIHIEVPEVGERVLKFGVVKRSPQLDVL